MVTFSQWRLCDFPKFFLVALDIWMVIPILGYAILHVLTCRILEIDHYGGK